MTRLVALSTVCLMAVLMIGADNSPGSAQEKEKVQEAGTDPRDFAPKFMPYYRFTELKNGLTQDEATIFGLIAFSKNLALTYEIPLGYQRDIRDTNAFKASDSLLAGGGIVTPNALPAGEGDGEETGVGDMNLRLLYNAGDALGGSLMLGVQVTFPTATDDLLSAELVQISPVLTYIYDLGFWPGPGAFIAGMNFYFFDAFGESSAGNVSFYMGRYFIMLPLTNPAMGLLGGIYLLPEFQPIYDFENDDHFSFWAGPEIGKMLRPGSIVYAKPGFGVSADDGSADRDFTFEVGWRLFL